VDAIRTAHPDATVAVWAEDEPRLGLLPVVRRGWALRGTRPTAWVPRRDQWRYGYGFVRPTTGARWWGLLPTVKTAAMQRALDTFAREEGIDAAPRAVLVLDRAGWHTTTTLVLPDGVDLVPLPPASPELQPAERLWPVVNEPIATRVFADLDALADILVTRCRTLRADRRASRALTHYWSWPSDHPAPIQE